MNSNHKKEVGASTMLKLVGMLKMK